MGTPSSEPYQLYGDGKSKVQVQGEGRLRKLLSNSPDILDNLEGDMIYNSENVELSF